MSSSPSSIGIYVIEGKGTCFPRFLCLCVMRFNVEKWPLSWLQFHAHVDHMHAGKRNPAEKERRMSQLRSDYAIVSHDLRFLPFPFCLYDCFSVFVCYFCCNFPSHVYMNVPCVYVWCVCVILVAPLLHWCLFHVNSHFPFFYFRSFLCSTFLHVLAVSVQLFNLITFMQSTLGNEFPFSLLIHFSLILSPLSSACSFSHLSIPFLAVDAVIVAHVFSFFNGLSRSLLTSGRMEGGNLVLSVDWRSLVSGVKNLGS